MCQRQSPHFGSVEKQWGKAPDITIAKFATRMASHLNTAMAVYTIVPATFLDAGRVAMRTFRGMAA